MEKPDIKIIKELKDKRLNYDDDHEFRFTLSKIDSNALCSRRDAVRSASLEESLQNNLRDVPQKTKP